MTGSERPFDEDDVLASLLGASDDASRLRALLAAAAAPSADGPQPGEPAALAAFRELVTESAGVPSLAHRRRARLAVAAASTVVMVLGGGAAAAAAGALPDNAQQVAKNVLGVVGVHVPGPSGGQHGNGTHGTHPGDGTDTGDTPSGSPSPLPTPTQTPPAAMPTHPSHPAHPTTPANPHATSHSTPPGNSAWGHSHRSPSPSTSSGASPTRPSSTSRSTAPGHTKHTAAPAATAHRFTPVPRSSGVRNARAALSD